MRYTIIGASGFIGAALAERLRQEGHEVDAPGRGATGIFDGDLGHVVYAAGVTADFRRRPFDTLHANTTLVADMLERSTFDSFLYLSSARVYRHAGSSREDAVIALDPAEPEDLYDFTKLTAESLCHGSGRKNARIARLSNVVGADFKSQNFIPALIRDACGNGRIELESSLDSSKDYISLEDVLEMIPKIAAGGRHACYNLCSGANLTHRQVVGEIQRVTRAVVSVREDAPAKTAGAIDIGRLRAEFGYDPAPVLPLLAGLVEGYEEWVRNENRP